MDSTCQRSRKQLCGQTPSIAGAVASAQPRAKAADKPIQITLDAAVNVAPTAKTVAKAKVAAAPKPRRVSVAGPAAASKPVTIAASPVVIRPAAKVAQPKVVSVQPQTSHGVSPGCCRCL